jgi:iron(III) transport system permease protein
VGRHLTWSRHRLGETALFGGASLVPIAAALLPLLVLVGLGVEHGVEVLGSARPWVLLGRSLALSCAVSAGAMLLGVPLGVAFARLRVPFPWAFLCVHALPLFLPPLLPALGWFHLFGRQGLLGSEATARLLFSPVGAALVLILTLAPVVSALTALGVLAVDPSLEEAARTVARPGRVLARIVVPAAWPAIVLAALVVFSLTLSELGVPMFLRVEVFPAAVFARLGGVDYAPGEAAALVAPLIPVAAGLLALERWLLRRRGLAVLGLRGRDRQRLDLGRANALASLACTLAAALSALPIVTLVVEAARGDGFAGLRDWVGSSPMNTLVCAALAATVITASAVVLGHGLARRRPGARLVDGLAVLAFFTPAAVLGVGLVATWNHGATRIVYGTLAILVVGFVARYTAIGVRTFAVVVSQSPLSLEEAAAAAGAGYGRRLLRLVVPLHWRGALAAWLFALVFCLRDLETAVLFYPPGGETLTVRIFTLEANGPPATVAALALVQVGLTVAALAVGGAVLRLGRAR